MIRVPITEEHIGICDRRQVPLFTARNGELYAEVTDDFLDEFLLEVEERDNELINESRNSGAKYEPEKGWSYKGRRPCRREERGEQQ